MLNFAEQELTAAQSAVAERSYLLKAYAVSGLSSEYGQRLLAGIKSAQDCWNLTVDGGPATRYALMVGSYIPSLCADILDGKAEDDVKQLAIETLILMGHQIGNVEDIKSIKDVVVNRLQSFDVLRSLSEEPSAEELRRRYTGENFVVGIMVAGSRYTSDDRLQVFRAFVNNMSEPTDPAS